MTAPDAGEGLIAVDGVLADLSVIGTIQQAADQLLAGKALGQREPSLTRQREERLTEVRIAVCTSAQALDRATGAKLGEGVQEFFSFHSPHRIPRRAGAGARDTLPAQRLARGLHDWMVPGHNTGTRCAIHVGG